MRVETSHYDSQFPAEADANGAVIRSRATYFGPTDASLFGVVTMPASAAGVRAGVLVCPSLGKEQAETTRWFKLFAERLAARGFVVLRYDHPNTGESVGAQDAPEAAANWVRGVRTAVDYLRSMGVESVIGLGHRAGALILGESGNAADGVPLSSYDALVLWDPLTKGRNYIRAKSVLYNMVSELPADLTPPAPAGPEAGGDPDARIHIAGQSLDTQAAAQFSALRLDSMLETLGTHDNVLAVVRETEPKWTAQLGAAGADIHQIGDQEPFLEPSHPAILAFPVADISAVIDWIDRVAGTASTPVHPEFRDSATVGHGADGRPVVTRLRTTDDGTTLWDTAFQSQHEHSIEVFIAHSLGQYIRTGPSRLWSDAALEVARHGGRAVRFDRVGVGESGEANEADAYLPLYTRDYIQGGTGLIRHLNIAPGTRIVQAGICVGSWMAAHGALAAARDNDLDSSVVLVNPLMWRLTPERVYRPSDLGADVPMAGLPRTDTAVTLTRRVRRKLLWIGGRSASRLRRWLPRGLWRAAGCVPTVQMPDAAFETLRRSGVATHLVFAPVDYHNFVTATGGDQAVRDALSPVRLTAVSAGDHTSYHAAMRRAAITEVLATLRLGGPS